MNHKLHQLVVLKHQFMVDDVLLNMSFVLDLQLLTTKSISLNQVVLSHLMQAFMN
jgi:hypothetical protein